MAGKSVNFDFEKIKEGKAYDILRPLGRFICKLFFKVEYVGTENIPEDGGFIVASNHIHALDPLIIALGIKNRQLHFMAKKELFDNIFVAKLITIVNAFPIVRGGADARALNYAKRIPAEGHILGIFIEGTRSKDGTPQRAKKGVASIANYSKCNVLPVSVYNNDGLKKHTKYTVRFGKAIDYSELNMSEEPSRDELGFAADYIMDKIKLQWEEGHCN